MASYNKVLLIGNLTRDPEHKQVGSGSVCRLGLAVNRQFKNKQTGAVTQEVCYIDVDVWGVQADSCKQYLSKGRPVLVEGRLKYDTWKDEQSGQMRSKHSIFADTVQFLPSNATAADGQFANQSDEGFAAPDFGKKVSPAARSNSFNSDSDGVNTSTNAQFALEKELLGQIEQIKERAAKNAVKKTKKPDDMSVNQSGLGDTSFRDEPPFDDELPF